VPRGQTDVEWTVLYEKYVLYVLVTYPPFVVGWALFSLLATSVGYKLFVGGKVTLFSLILIHPSNERTRAGRKLPQLVVYLMISQEKYHFLIIKYSSESTSSEASII
jgi:hypothetical protein